MPDAIAAYRSRGTTWTVTANEGDGRDYDAYTDEGRIGDDDVTLNPANFMDAGELQMEENLGRLKFVTTEGDTNGDGEYEELYTFGARSFTIRDTAGNIVFDSGDDFERITEKKIPADYNSTNDENDSFDNRSDDNGPEPEGVVIGKVRGETYAFVGLERVGGIMIYNVTDPTHPSFVDYVNKRDFAVDADTPEAGDLGPEGLLFIKAGDSPNGKPMLVVGNEISGTTTLFKVVSK